MKIFFTMSSVFNPYSGGVQMTTFKMGSYFNSRGHDVHFYSLAHEGHVKPDFGTLYYSKEKGRDENPNNVQHLMSVITQVSPDVIINQKPYEENTQLALHQYRQTNKVLLLGCLRNSLFATKNNLDSYADRKLKAVAGLFKNKVGRALLLLYHKTNHKKYLRNIVDRNDYFVLFGPPNLEEYRYFVGDYKTDKIAYFPNTIPAVEPTLPEKEKILLYVGRLEDRQKRADLLFPLWKRVMEQLPDWRLVLVGSGPSEAKMKRLLENGKLQGVEMTGRQVPDKYYKAASLFVMPSSFEGFPNVVIEAQSYGCIPLAFDNFPMLSWIVADQKNAMLSKPFNIDKMAADILLLANDPEKRKQMGEDALNNARRFEISKVGNAWLEFFEKELKRIRN